MYIWVAIDIDDQLLSIKNKAKEIEKAIDFQDSDITLPLHISLKISSSVPEDQVPMVLEDLIQILQEEAPFEVETEKIELHETICWLKMKTNPRLVALHEKMNQLFLGKYNIPLHTYDKDFQFHATLFLDRDGKKVKEAFLAIMKERIPTLLKAESFVIGGSPDGSIGSYKVFTRVTCKDCQASESTSS